MKHNFRELEVWKLSMDLVVKTYSITKTIPLSERYNFISQINRSALSIPSNIAEGTSRNSIKDLTRFINIALGSSYELETQLILANRIFNNLYVEEILLDILKIQNYLGAFKRRINS